MDDYDVLGGAIPRPAKDKVGEGDDVDEGSDAPQPGAPRRRDWSDEEKAWIVQESFERGTTVEEVAERHGVPSRRLSYWRKLARKGELVVPPAPPSEGPFATVEVESAPAPAHVGSVSIEARGVTVRLDGDVSTVRITSIASALRALR